MKKIVLCIAAFAFCISASYAWTIDGQGKFTSDCGVISLNEPTMDQFPSIPAAVAFFDALNYKLCHGGGIPQPPSQPQPPTQP